MKIDNLQNKNALKWSKETGVILLTTAIGSYYVLEELWKNWNKMSNELKKLSDNKALQLFGKTNKQIYLSLKNVVKYDGFPFILHQHNPRNGSEHYDLRFLDLKDSKLLHSFALPDNWQEDINKTVLFKTRDHDPRWLTLKSYRLKTIDEGFVNYKIYKPYGYFLLEFTGKIINGTYQLFKLRDKFRKDVWMLVKKH